MSEQPKKVVKVDGTWVRKEDRSEMGESYGLVIGIGNYLQGDVHLETAVSDAKSVVKNLRESYGFEKFVELYDKDVTARNLKLGIYKLREVVTPQDSVLIYFSGLGSAFGSTSALGYWVPVDAKPGEWHKCLEIMTLRGLLRHEFFPARHVLVISDARFCDGSLQPAARAPKATPQAIQAAIRTPSREFLLSGTEAPVPHETGRHSVFASYFLSLLRRPPREIFTVAELFARIKGRVGELNPPANGVHQSPVHGILLNAGHEEGGAFVFAQRTEEPVQKKKPSPAELSASMKFEYRRKELERKAQERQSTFQKEKRISSAKKAFGSARKVDEMDGVTPKEKIDVWMEYIREFPEASEQLVYAKSRVDQLGKKLAGKPEAAPTSPPKAAKPEPEKEKDQNKANVFVQQYFSEGSKRFDQGDYPKAIEYFAQLLILDPRNVDAYNMRGLALMESGEYEKAVVDYTHALEIDPNSSDAYYNRGNAHLREKRYDYAIDDVSKAIRLKPNDADAYYLRGAAYDARKEYPQAIEDFSAAIKLNPEDGSYYYNRGLAYLDSGQHEKAVQDMNAAIKLGQSDTIVYFNRGVALLKTRHLDEAIADLSRVIKAEPDNLEARGHRAYTALLKKQYDHAIEDYTRLIADNPNEPDFYYKRGIAYFQKGDTDLAIADFNTVREFHPRNAEFYVYLGDAYSRKGNYRQAIPYYTQALEIEPGLFDAWLKRGVAYCELVEHQSALDDFDRAIRLNPKDPRVYNYRAQANFHKGAYGNAWKDVDLCRDLGGTPDAQLLSQLKKNTGRD